MSLLQRVPFAVALSMLPLSAIFAQRDNPFSANPEVRATVASVKRVEQRPSVTSDNKTADLTRVYRIGRGDALYIVLENAPNASGYYPVRADGTIDFPLAGDDPAVTGMTTSDIAQLLSSRIKLYRNARVSVQVRQFGSHKISVSGLVERSGERFIQREAMPLFSVKADGGVKSDATTVVIKRSLGTIETYRLNDEHTDDVLVSAGDIVEFAK